MVVLNYSFRRSSPSESDKTKTCGLEFAFGASLTYLLPPLELFDFGVKQKVPNAWDGINRVKWIPSLTCISWRGFGGMRDFSTGALSFTCWRANWYFVACLEPNQVSSVSTNRPRVKHGEIWLYDVCGQSTCWNKSVLSCLQIIIVVKVALSQFSFCLNRIVHLHVKKMKCIRTVSIYACILKTEVCLFKDWPTIQY